MVTHNESVDGWGASDLQGRFKTSSNLPADIETVRGDLRLLSIQLGKNAVLTPVLPA
jgi:hypothetical protein